MGETWLPIPGWEGLYEVSDLGRIRSFKRSRPRIITGCKNSHGYVQVILYRDGERTYVKVHALVMLAFVGPRPDGLVTCHSDDDKANNRLDNLRYDTQAANNLDILLHGRHSEASKTHCKHGHEFTPENTYRSAGGRHRTCITCRRRTRRLQRKRARAATQAA